MELQSKNGDIGTNHDSGIQRAEHQNKIPAEALCVLEEGDAMMVKVDHEAKTQLIYGVLDRPPLSVSIICGFQQALLSLAAQLIVSLLVADALCARDNDDFKVKLLSSTNFMTGITTIAMVLIGVRLPLFQGAASAYIIPLLIISSADSTFCSSSTESNSDSVSFNGNATMEFQTNATEAHMERILNNARALSGSLMIGGAIHALLGASGLIGLLLRFIGPITIVPCMILGSVFIVVPILTLVKVHWGIALSTVGVSIILSLYLQSHKAPVPVWTPSIGFRIIWYPVHQVFSILISILFNWMLCGILTVTGALTEDITDQEYNARTDARSDVITNSPWFNIPYPGIWDVILSGQFGRAGFSIAAFFACFMATMLSILDSIGDYYACARVSRVPPPPVHAVNRGIVIEGLCSLLSGAVGCGHATTTFGGNIGAIGITKVASRRVFVCTGILYIIFGIVGKFSAVFITIPYPVLGGASIAMFSAFLGVSLSNLQVMSLSSSRNMSILGFSVILGIMIPTYVNRSSNAFNTGNDSFDKVMAMILGNPTFAGTILAFFLDNTVPGTLDERGISAWQVPEETDSYDIDPDLYDNGYEVYQPLIPEFVLKSSLMKYIPFLPHIKTLR